MPVRIDSRAATHLRLARWVGSCFGGEEEADAVSTRVGFPVPAETLWQSLMTYEEVRLPPPWWMGRLLPRPLGTQGDKTRVGATLPCRYEGGDLLKRILVSQPPRRLEFEVISQRLGVEDCIRARTGSYEIRERGTVASEIELVTRYGARLHPRWLWRPFEHWLAHRFHRHILRAMRSSIEANRLARREVA